MFFVILKMCQTTTIRPILSLHMKQTAVRVQSNFWRQLLCVSRKAAICVKKILQFSLDFIANIDSVKHLGIV